MNTDGLDDLQEVFRREGVVYIPQALDAETLELAERAWHWSLAHPGPVAWQSGGLKGMASAPDGPDPSLRAAAGAAGYFYQDAYNPEAQEAYQELVTRPVFLNLVSRLFAPGDGGKAEAHYLGEQVFLMEGGPPGRGGWHQDLGGTDAHGDNLITVWMAFDSVGLGGGVNLVRRSHRGPKYASVIGGFEGEPIPDVESHPEDFDIVSFATEPGDLIVFHMAMLHGKGPTLPGQRRRTLALRYQGPDSDAGGRHNRKQVGGNELSKTLYGAKSNRQRVRVL